MQAVVDTLTEHGLDSSLVEDEGYVLVQLGDDARDPQDVLSEIETWLTERGLPFVPEEVDGRILIRPPAS